MNVLDVIDYCMFQNNSTVNLILEDNILSINDQNAYSCGSWIVKYPLN